MLEEPLIISNLFSEFSDSRVLGNHERLILLFGALRHHLHRDTIFIGISTEHLFSDNCLMNVYNSIREFN